MKNKYNIAAYKECAEVKVYHKVNNYSFFTEKEKRGIENAVEYTDLTNEDNYHLFLKEYDEESIRLIYEYNETISKEQLNERRKVYEKNCGRILVRYRKHQSHGGSGGRRHKESRGRAQPPSR